MPKYLFGFLALLLCTSCHVSRYVTHNFANITDHKVKEVVIVRQGKKWDEGYLWLFRALGAKL